MTFSSRFRRAGLTNILIGTLGGSIFSLFCLVYSQPKTFGPSMLPTINVKGVRVYVDKSYRRGKGVKLGDVVNFHLPHAPGHGAAKRVMGMPGDFVERGGRMMVQVPQGHCWVLGDNLPESRDSRTFGPLPLALIKGKVVAKIWPWKDVGWVANTLQPPEE